MGDDRQILADKTIARLCGREKRYKARDSKLPDFFALVGKRRKTFTAQGELWRDGVPD